MNSLEIEASKPFDSVVTASNFIIENIKHLINEFYDTNKNEIPHFINTLIIYRQDNKWLHWSAKGRSNSALKAFMIRLKQLGYLENNLNSDAPYPISDGEIGIILTGSGSTDTCISHAATILKKESNLVFAITSFPDAFEDNVKRYYLSTEGKEIKAVKDRMILLKLPGRTASKQFTKDYDISKLEKAYEAITPMRTLFEDSALIIFDALIPYISKMLNKSEAEMIKGHSNAGQYGGVRK